MLSRDFRLTKKTDFKKIAKEGKVIQSDSFGLAFLDRKDIALPKFGFVISTRIAKEATKRNKAKRALSEGVRIKLSEIRNGFNIVFLAKQSILKKTREVIIKEVEVALKNSNLIK